MASLNGTTIYPSNIEPELIIVGEMLEAVDGTSTLIKDGTGPGEKWRWTITWENVAKSVRDAVRTIAKLNASFTFVDEDGDSYTVLPELQPYSHRVNTVVSNTVNTYDVTLKIRES